MKDQKHAQIYFNDRSDSSTGTFTVPAGGDGFYYFSMYFYVVPDEFGRFEIQLNGEVLCTAEADRQDTPSDGGQAACSAASQAMEGLFSQLMCYVFFKFKFLSRTNHHHELLVNFDH